jgi:hypothetical protein
MAPTQREIFDEFAPRNIWPPFPMPQDTTRAPSVIQADIEKQLVIVHEYDQALKDNGITLVVGSTPTFVGDPHYAFSALNHEYWAALRKGNK